MGKFWIIILIIIGLPGCDEYSANTRPDSALLSTISGDDSPEIQQYAAAAREARLEAYGKLKKPRAQKLFTQKADEYDLGNIQDIRDGRSAARQMDMNFPEPQFDTRPTPTYVQPSPMQYQSGQYGDMYRLGQSMGAAGQAQSDWANQRYEEDAQDEARNAMYAYMAKLDRLKLRLMRPM